MDHKPRISFQCDECGHQYDVSAGSSLISREGLEFHVSVSKSRHPANYCRLCLVDKLRLLADEIANDWPDLVLG